MNHEAINGARRKINEALKKQEERIVVGWTPAHVDRKEGDVWEERGRTWTKKDGIIQTITKLQDAKTPLFCPQCGKPFGYLGQRFDVKFWRIRGKCFDCVIKDETEMRRNGTWKQYELEKMRANYIAEMKDTLIELQHLYENVSAPEIVHADETRILMIEKWDVDVNKVKADLLEDINMIKQRIAEAEQGETNESDNQVSSKS